MSWLSGWLYTKATNPLEEISTFIETSQTPSRTDCVYPVTELRFLADTIAASTPYPPLRSIAQTLAQLDEEQIEINFARYATPIILHAVYAEDEHLKPLRQQFSNSNHLLAFLFRPLVSFQDGVWNTYRFHQAEELLKTLKNNAVTKENLYARDRKELTALPYTSDRLASLREVRREIERDEREFLLHRLYVEIYRTFIENSYLVPYEWRPPVRYLNPTPHLIKFDPHLRGMGATYYLDRYSPGWGLYLLRQSFSSGMLEVRMGRWTHRCRFLMKGGENGICRSDLLAIEAIMLKAILEQQATPLICGAFLRTLCSTQISDFFLCSLKNHDCFEIILRRLYATTPSQRK